MCAICERAVKLLTINLITNVDPTRTLSTRKRFVADVDRRFRALKNVVREYIESGVLLKRDTFSDILTTNATPTQWASRYDPNRIPEFMDWLEEQNKKFILSNEWYGIETFKPYVTEGGVTPFRRLGGRTSRKWTDVHIRSAYQKGVQRARGELRKQGVTVTGGLGGVFNAPFHVDRIQLAFTQTYAGMQGVTKAMEAPIARAMAQGMARGWNPKTIAREIAGIKGAYDVTKMRGKGIIDKKGWNNARTLARTEVIRAHHGANIAEMRAMGIEEVIVKAEWLTAGDNRVCPRCEGREGIIYKLSEIEPEIPLHPNCRCVAIPIVPRKGKKRRRVKKGVDKKPIRKIRKKPIRKIRKKPIRKKPKQPDKIDKRIKEIGKKPVPKPKPVPRFDESLLWNDCSTIKEAEEQFKRKMNVENINWWGGRQWKDADKLSVMNDYGKNLMDMKRRHKSLPAMIDFGEPVHTFNVHSSWESIRKAHGASKVGMDGFWSPGPWVDGIYGKAGRPQIHVLHEINPSKTMGWYRNTKFHGYEKRWSKNISKGTVEATEVRDVVLGKVGHGRNNVSWRWYTDSKVYKESGQKALTSLRNLRDPTCTLRHEFAHHFHLIGNAGGKNVIPREAHKAWDRLTKKGLRPDKRFRGISNYANKGGRDDVVEGMKELFSESLTAYTQDNYQANMLGKPLPHPWGKERLEKVIKPSKKAPLETASDKIRAKDFKFSDVKDIVADNDRLPLEIEGFFRKLLDGDYPNLDWGHFKADMKWNDIPKHMLE
jgi:SPP1 gp7 family putative phage head morphogenesis protein|tara:strand:+ start:46 stop:2349 length:2304 start_codon:yes stop_codon:yes gene_type:complete